MKLIFVCNIDSFFISHRLPIAIKAKELGYEVTLVAAQKDNSNGLSSYGINFINLPFERSGKNPFHELKCIFKLRRIYKLLNPDIIHHVTLKACLLGSIAAKLSNEKNIINALSGLGYTFTSANHSFLQSIISLLIRYAFKSASFHFILQNPDDLNYIKNLKLVPANNLHLIKGSGINLEQYKYHPPITKSQLIILFPARILIDKGVLEFLEAAQKIKQHIEKSSVKFILAGECDKGNPTVLNEDKINHFLDRGYIEWIGFQKDMYNVYVDSDIVVLPSYREGLPKSLIEACAVGRPIITTNVPGCRECVIEGYNGFLVPPKDSNAIVSKLLELIPNKGLMLQMGKYGRKLAEKEFSIETVVNRHIQIYNEL